MDNGITTIPKVEFRIPISANEKYLRMVQYFLESIQVFAGPLAKAAHCVISVSRDEPYRDLYIECPWTKMYSVEFRWIDSDLFEKYEYNGTSLDRYFVKSNANVIIFCDADILIAGNFDEVIWKSFQEKKELGFIAHVSPFNNLKFDHKSSITWWEELYRESRISPPAITQTHTGWGLMGSTDGNRHKNCPYYFNYGFVITLREFAEKISTTIEQDLANVGIVIETWFKSQIANSLSYSRHNIPCDTFSINYNFPLHVSEEKIRKINPDNNGNNNPEDIKVFHYLGNGDFNKEDFTTEETLQIALNKQAIGSRQVFLDRLRVVHERINIETNINTRNISSG